MRSWGHTLPSANNQALLDSFKDSSIKDLLSHKEESILFDAELMFGGDPITGGLFRREIQPIIDRWEKTSQESMVELETLSNQVFDPEVLDSVWNSFTQAQSAYDSMPSAIDPSSREDGKENRRAVGRWLRVWVRLNRAARAPKGEPTTSATMSSL
jgi:hypothetical protein